MNKNMRFLALFVLILVLIFPTQAQDVRSVLTNTINNDQAYTATRFSVAEDGKTFVAEMRALSGDLDPQIFVIRADDPERIPIAFNDNRSAGTRDAFIAIPNIPVGEYILIAARYNLDAGSSTGDYELSMGFSTPGSINISYDLSDAGLQAAGYPAISPQPQASWTVLAYYGADNDLEPGVLNDFNEFELAGGSDSTVRVVAMVDRIPGHASVGDDWQTARIYEVSADVTGDTASFPPTPDSQPLAELGELDMGDGRTLAQFLAWGMRQYPADNYAIAFASHGAAWRGLVRDDTNGQDFLSVPELEQAFSQSLQSVGRAKFDLLINDACYMSSIEYYAGVAPYFNLSIASAEYVVDPALDMTALVNALRQNPGGDTSQLSAQLVNSYINTLPLRREDLRQYLTNAVTNLNQFGAVADEINSFSRLVNTDLDRYGNVIAQARMFTYEYSSFLGINSYIDLGQFMQNVANTSPYPELKDAANRVLSALSMAHVFGDAGAFSKNLTSYYNIYFPKDAASMSQDYFIESKLVDWGEMLRNYYALFTPQSWSGTRAALVPDEKDSLDLNEIQLNLENIRISDISGEDTRFVVGDDPDIAVASLAFHESVLPTVSITADASRSPLPINTTFTGRDLRDVRLTFDLVREDGTMRRYINQSLTSDEIVTPFLGDGVFEFASAWQPEVLNLSNGFNPNPEFSISTPNSDLVTIEAKYRAPELDNFNDVSLLFNASTGDLVQALSYDPDTDSAASIEIPLNSLLQVYRQIVTPDGRIVREAGNLYSWTENMTVDYRRPDNGLYKLGVQVFTFAGVQEQATVDLIMTSGIVKSVENVTANTDITWTTDFVGSDNFSDIASIAYPSDWDVTISPNSFMAQRGKDDVIFELQLIDSISEGEAITCESISQYARRRVRPVDTSVQLEETLYNNKLNWFAEQWVYNREDVVGRTYATVYEMPSGETVGLVATMSLPFDDLNTLYDVFELMVDSIDVPEASLTRCSL